MTQINYFIHEDYAPFKNYLLAQNPPIIQLEKGDYLTNIAEPLNNIYFILEGLVVNAMIGENGFEKSFISYGANTILPLYSPVHFAIEDSLILRVVQKGRALVFTKEEFSAILQKNQDLNNQMYISYIKHMTFFQHENFILITQNGMTRICYFLLNYLKNHHPKDDVIPISQQDIAKLVGLNTINTSRNFKVLKEKKIVDTGRNKIIILDKEKLKRFVQD